MLKSFCLVVSILCVSGAVLTAAVSADEAVVSTCGVVSPVIASGVVGAVKASVVLNGESADFLREASRALIFAWCMHQFYNAHRREPFMVPVYMSLWAYYTAHKYENVEAEEIVAMIIAEHGGGYPYPADSVGKAGEFGLLQLSGYWLRKYNKDHGTTFVDDDLFDWRTNITIGAYAISAMKHTHATAARCKSLVYDTTRDGSGKIVPVKRKQRHSWTAHYRCAPKYREKCVTKYRDALIVLLAEWKEVWESSGSTNLDGTLLL